MNSNSKSNILRLVFTVSSEDCINPPYCIKLGSFTNTIVNKHETPLNQHRVANMLKSNCLQSELKRLIGWMIDDGTVYDSNNIPLDKIHPFSVRSWNHAIKATALNSKGYTNG
jgi:hypothetical protein